MTVQDLINQSLAQLNAIAAGETPAAAESADALVALNALIDNWSAQLGPIPYLTREVIGLANESSKVLTTRPLKIKSASVSPTGSGLAIPVRVVTSEEWSTGGGTQFMPFLLCDYGYTSATIYLRPIFTGNLELLSLKPLSRFASLAATVDLPQGYERALINGLAAELLTQYPQVADKLAQHLVGLANDAKISIQGLNQSTLGPVAPAPQQAAQ